TDKAAFVVKEETPLAARRVLLHGLPTRPVNLPVLVRVALGVLRHHPAKAVIAVTHHNLVERILRYDKLVIGIIKERAGLLFRVGDGSQVQLSNGIGSVAIGNRTTSAVGNRRELQGAAGIVQRERTVFPVRDCLKKAVGAVVSQGERLAVWVGDGR